MTEMTGGPIVMTGEIIIDIVIYMLSVNIS